MSKEVVIASAVRTAVGTFGGSLKDVPAVELGAIVKICYPQKRARTNDIRPAINGERLECRSRLGAVLYFINENQCPPRNQPKVLKHDAEPFE